MDIGWYKYKSIINFCHNRRKKSGKIKPNNYLQSVGMISDHAVLVLRK